MLRKGQAAMEFLMTYGWAILVVLIAIGALAYFGVLNPSRFLPESCTIGPGVSCDDFIVKGASVVGSKLVIRNGMGTKLTGVAVQLKDDSAATTCPLSDATCLLEMEDGEQCTYTSAVACATGGVGTKFKGTITFTYIKDSITHSKTGTVTTKLE